MTPVLDPFMADVRPTGLQRGRGGFLRSADDAPYVTDPSGELCKTGDRKGQVRRLKYGSPSNAGRLVENDVGLTKHKQRHTLLGIGMDTALAEACRDLVVMDADSEEFRHAADKIAVEADRLTRSWLAADRGTHGHLLCEIWDRAEPFIGRFAEIEPNGIAVGLDRNKQRDVVEAWSAMLEDNCLEILEIEASCVDDRWRLAGTLDRIVRTTRPLTFVKASGELVVIPANTVLILDIKFGKCRLAHPIQIASYAQSVPYDTETETRGVWPWPIDQTHALIAKGDFGDDTRPPSFELVWVDLVAGREHGGETVVQAKAWAARDDVFSVAQVDTPAATTGYYANGGNLAPPVAVEELALLDPMVQRLALVQARDQLTTEPDQGRDMEHDFTLWYRLRKEFDDLPPAAKSWRWELCNAAQRRGVPFHAQAVRTERSYHLNKAVICLALADPSDDILRALMAPVVGDIAWFQGVEPGHILGSMGVAEAKQLAALVDAYISEPPPAA